MASKWLTDGDIDWNDGDVLYSADLEDTFKASQVPIGGIIPWCKSLTGAPTLASSYVECNGQTLSDANSPFNGQVIPDLNGSGGSQRFLRGSSTSGSTGGSDTINIQHTHVVNSGGTNATFGGAGTISTTGSTTQSVLPSYYEVVWVMRIK